mgnify:CR=1 FL=1
MSYVVKMQYWFHGTLVSNDFEFETDEEALNFSHSFPRPAIMKVYDNDNELIHEATPVNFEELQYA